MEFKNCLVYTVAMVSLGARQSRILGLFVIMRSLGLFLIMRSLGLFLIMRSLGLFLIFSPEKS